MINKRDQAKIESTDKIIEIGNPFAYLTDRYILKNFERAGNDEDKILTSDPDDLVFQGKDKKPSLLDQLLTFKKKSFKK